MPFVDGEPIDASKLGLLETELNKLKAEIPKIGASSTAISISQTVQSSTISSTQTKVPPQIFGGITGEISLTAGSRKTFTINYTAAGLTAPPKAIILTPVGPVFTSSLSQATVIDSSITATSATGQIYHRPEYTPIKIRYYFIVIQHA